ncbi:MAG: DNA alkylation repair protein [Ignavibacteria bacterium]|nr:DNA alkylation repair protein [Ignavibacteria bacterium]
MLRNLKADLKKIATPKKAKASLWFFKTGKGEYGEGDKFIGVTVPEQRKIASKYKNLSLVDISQLLKSKIHEERSVALFILVKNFQTNESKRSEIFAFYLKHRKFVNNWDLVDSSADKIVGAYLIEKDKFVLNKLAVSKDVWDRRIAIVSTFYFIKNNKFEETFRISKILINDHHDLIHKAVGWMLKEVGKRDESKLENYLKVNYKLMPRTMLRFTIEKLSDSKRKKYLSGNI